MLVFVQWLRRYYVQLSIVEGQVGEVPCPLYSGASLQRTSWGGPLSYIYSGTSLQRTSWGGPLSYIYIVEPLYKGQIGDMRLSSSQMLLHNIRGGGGIRGDAMINGSTALLTGFH